MVEMAQTVMSNARAMRDWTVLILGVSSLAFAVFASATTEVAATVSEPAPLQVEL